METQKCFECSKDLGREAKTPTKHLSCSIECACYAGAFNMKTGWNYDRIKEIYETINKV